MKTIRWGVIGCGDVVRKRVAAAIRQTPGNLLLAACRRDPVRLEEFCAAVSVERGYSDAAALLADPEIDAVYLATPVRWHLPQTELAAAAGKHVLVEKPMAISVAECDRMIEVCERADVRLGVAYYRRFYPMIERIESLLDQGVIGTPLGVAAVTATPLAMRPGEEGYWRTDLTESGGGALMDVGSHRINLMLRLFGKIVDVKSMSGQVAGPGDVEDASVSLFRFESGMLGTLQCHFGAEDPDDFTITGTEGRLTARPLNGDQLVIETAAGRRVESLPPAANLCAPLIADFAEAIREGRAPRVDGVEGRATQRIIAHAYADANAPAALPVRLEAEPGARQEMKSTSPSPPGGARS